MTLTREAEATPPRQLRDFGIPEITARLIPMAPGHLRRVLRETPGLPQGRNEGGARWFTLEEVDEIRAHLERSGTPGRYRPWRPVGAAPKIIALVNPARGSGRTTLALHLAMAAALDGYRVRAIDLDPGAGLTAALGDPGPAGEGAQDTALALFARQAALHLRGQNQARLDRGDAPVPMDAVLGAALETAPAALARPTHWPGIALVPARPELALADLHIPQWRTQIRGWRPWEALSRELARPPQDGEAAPDLVILDTPPSLGPLALAAAAAADVLLVPLEGDAAGTARAGQAFGMLHSAFAAIEEEEAAAARALGTQRVSFAWDALRAVITRYDPIAQGRAAGAIQAGLGPALAAARIEAAPILAQESAVYEAVPRPGRRGGDRQGLARARASFDAAYAEIRDLLQEGWRRGAEAR
ncbi:AAA family ATPase [Pseudoroseicyclus aestuarii]|nr:AAA family ATPase [Pseudoroseicyclus aestuarii]